jgi:hypothetical protein
MARILIKGEVAPVVRFGIRQHSDGTLKAASPCCNRSMHGGILRCAGCGKDWVSEAVSPWNLSGPIQVQMMNDSYEWLREWAAGITKHENLVFEVS